MALVHLKRLEARKNMLQAYKSGEAQNPMNKTNDLTKAFG